MENILGNKEGFCKNLTVRKMEAHKKEARRIIDWENGLHIRKTFKGKIKAVANWNPRFW